MTGELNESSLPSTLTKRHLSGQEGLGPQQLPLPLFVSEEASGLYVRKGAMSSPATVAPAKCASLPGFLGVLSAESSLVRSCRLGPGKGVIGKKKRRRAHRHGPTPALLADNAHPLEHASLRSDDPFRLSGLTGGFVDG
jgi:hypothetical protein